MKHSELKQLIREEIQKEFLKEDDSKAIEKLKTEINGAFRSTTVPSFDSSRGGKDTYTDKTPTMKQIISQIEGILEKYK
jgi:hypothetical protein